MNSIILQKFERITNIQQASTKIDLTACEVWSGEVNPGAQIACEQGTVWITQSNDPDDYILHPGQRFLATCYGKVVAQALATASSLRI